MLNSMNVDGCLVIRPGIFVVGKGMYATQLNRTEYKKVVMVHVLARITYPH